MFIPSSDESGGACHNFGWRSKDGLYTDSCVHEIGTIL